MTEFEEWWENQSISDTQKTKLMRSAAKAAWTFCEQQAIHGNGRVSDSSQSTGSAWVETSKELPPLGQMVWCFEDGNVWLGSREDPDNEGWLWTQCYNHFWWNGKKYDGDFEADDDYRPTHWALVPEPPNA